jgi:hypothetical protein
MITTLPQRDYSTVDIRLSVGDRILDVAEASEYYLVLAEPAEVPPGTNAEIIIVFDGRESRRPIVLGQGISLDSRQVTFF